MTIACHRRKNWVVKLKTQKSLGVLKNIENFDHKWFWKQTNLKIQNAGLDVWNLLDDVNSLPQEKMGQKDKNWEIDRKFDRKWRFGRQTNLKSVGVLRNIISKKIKNERKCNFDNRRIWRSKMPVRNLLDDDNSLPQEKKLGWKVENLWVFYKILLVKNKGWTKRQFWRWTNLRIQNAGLESIRWWQ